MLDIVMITEVSKQVTIS